MKTPRSSTLSTSSTSLTARLARAAAAHDPTRRGVGPAMSAAEPAAAPVAVGVDSDRCTSSLIVGQRCSRIAPRGQVLCAGHAAMSGNGPAPTGRRQ